jgi:hypothetical protein
VDGFCISSYFLLGCWRTCQPCLSLTMKTMMMINENERGWGAEAEEVHWSLPFATFACDHGKQ